MRECERGIVARDRVHHSCCDEVPTLEIQVNLLEHQRDQLLEAGKKSLDQLAKGTAALEKAIKTKEERDRLLLQNREMMQALQKLTTCGHVAEGANGVHYPNAVDSTDGKWEPCPCLEAALKITCPDCAEKQKHVCDKCKREFNDNDSNWCLACRRESEKRKDEKPPEPYCRCTGSFNVNGVCTRCGYAVR